MPEISAIQKDLREAGLDGWLFYDFRGRDPLGARILALPEGMRTRRWFYFVPARGGPRKLVHRVEAGALDALPGGKLLYAAQDELEKNLQKLVGHGKRVAMQYSRRSEIPYVSTVDAGAVELVRSAGCKVVSSADLVQKYEACWTPAQLESHLVAGEAIDRIVREAFEHAARCVREKTLLTEYDLKLWILKRFDEVQITTEEGPDVAVGAHASDPHYQAEPGKASPIREGDLLLLDVWGKTCSPQSVYYDVTWVGYLGVKVPEKRAKIFEIVREARDRAIACVQEGLTAGRPPQGWQVDRAAREVIQRAGYGKYFFHRTGHSIGQTVHGNGANMDGFETHDFRRVIPGTCFSIEPGIYLPDFGVRSEVNVYVEKRQARVTGAVQNEILPLLA
jgi:Xaa-Pro aminopeptidase